jgi:dienelactone hydrolase
MIRGAAMKGYKFSTFLLLIFFLTGCSSNQIANTPQSFPTSTSIPATATLPPIPRIFIEPAESLIDQPVHIRLSGFLPGRKVKIQTTATWLEENQVTESFATFLTDSTGAVDLDQQAPVDGSYSTIDGMGLFWSMQEKSIVLTPTPQAEKFPSPTYLPISSLPVNIQYQFSAEIDGQLVVSTKIIRTFGKPGMTYKIVHENGLYGVLFTPPGSGPFPAIISIGGSEGGNSTQPDAIILASHGYVTFALAYFDRTGSSDLPSEHDSIPLEYFGKAIQRLQSESGVDPHRIGLIGISLGGEAALRIAATYPEIKAVISVSGSSLCKPVITGQKKSQWSYQGQEIPYITNSLPVYQAVQPFKSAVNAGEDPLPLVSNSIERMNKTKEITDATTPIEKINGPILLISGVDDRLWPSTLYSEYAIHRLDASKFAFPYRHLYFKGAGHFVGAPPYVAYNDPQETGGSIQANSQANAIAWEFILDYFGMMK